MNEAVLRLVFGPRLKVARNMAGLTQVQLAEKLDVSHRAVQQWEAGTMYPEMGKLPAIAQAVGKPIYWFFVDEFGDEAPQDVSRAIELYEQSLGKLGLFEADTEEEARRNAGGRHVVPVDMLPVLMELHQAGLIKIKPAGSPRHHNSEAKPSRLPKQVPDIFFQHLLTRTSPEATMARKLGEFLRRAAVRLGVKPADIGKRLRPDRPLPGKKVMQVLSGEELHGWNGVGEVAALLGFSLDDEPRWEPPDWVPAKVQRESWNGQAEIEKLMEGI